MNDQHKPKKNELAKSCTVHDDTQVVGFFEDYRFLSNFSPARVVFYGVIFPTVENAYQAAKCLDPEQTIEFTNISPQEAKKKGQDVKVVKNWEQIKVIIMYGLLIQKFNPSINVSSNELFIKLLATRNRHLEERNYWNDLFWGTDVKGNGLNTLGRLLMSIRALGFETL